MPVNDPVGDMLTRLRNASRAHHEKVVIPHSKLKAEIARCLKDEGYVGDVVLHEEGVGREMTIFLKYGPQKMAALQGIKRISRPGLRRYVGVDEIPSVLGGLGISILSTSRGVMVDQQARKQKVGGELICTVY